MTNKNNDVFDKIKSFQKAEITEYYIYQKIAKKEKNQDNKDILLSIAQDELKHYKMWEKVTNTSIKPSKWKIFIYSILNFIFGYTFTLRVMERGEENAIKVYSELNDYQDIINKITLEEEEHENKLLNLLDEERLNYVGSMVLGLNDALVELSGTLAGLTFAFANTSLISLSGLITGIAASLSMAASEYLSQRSEGEGEKAVKSSIYTGTAYIITVILLILPYLLIEHFMIALGATLSIGIAIIFFFNYYISIAKDLNFKARFSEMAIISLGVSAITFLIGVLVRQFIGIDI